MTTYRLRSIPVRSDKPAVAPPPHPQNTNVYLADFSEIAQTFRKSPTRFEGFRSDSRVLALRWPDDVLEQWLYDHADNAAFLRDYGFIDLSRVTWEVEVVSLASLLDMPTGPSDRNSIDEFAENPEHWIRVRRQGVHAGVAQCWAVHGTWKRWPLLLDRDLLDPPAPGLQVVEGRTRVGVLRGRRRKGDLVAPKHLAWVGRADNSSDFPLH